MRSFLCARSLPAIAGKSSGGSPFEKTSERANPLRYWYAREKNGHLERGSLIVVCFIVHYWNKKTELYRVESIVERDDGIREGTNFALLASQKIRGGSGKRRGDINTRHAPAAIVVGVLAVSARGGDEGGGRITEGRIKGKLGEVYARGGGRTREKRREEKRSEKCEEGCARRATRASYSSLFHGEQYCCSRCEPRDTNAGAREKGEEPETSGRERETAKAYPAVACVRDKDRAKRLFLWSIGGRPYKISSE